MIITAKYASVCPTCCRGIVPGTKVDWVKGSKATHVNCTPTAGASPAPAGKSWNPDKFNGYGRPRGGYTRSCKTGGNCSSFGSGRSCGAHDCDGY